MKKIFLPLLIIACLSTFPAYADDSSESGTEIIEINQLTEEEIQYVESLPSINNEIDQTNANNYVNLGVFQLTAYCECNTCNRPYTGEPTALGTDYVEGRTIAVDRSVIPLGSIVEIDIPGEGWHQFRAEDVGGRIKGNHIDVFVNGHSNCKQPRYNTYCAVRLVN